MRIKESPSLSFYYQHLTIIFLLTVIQTHKTTTKQSVFSTFTILTSTYILLYDKCNLGHPVGTFEIFLASNTLLLA